MLLPGPQGPDEWFVCSEHVVDFELTLKGVPSELMLTYDPGDHLKKCRSPRLEKCRKRASESARPKRGAEGGAQKSARGPVSCGISTEVRSPKHFLRRLPRHTVLGRHFPKHFFRRFSRQELRNFFRIV